ncbi:MAG: hypothetical protein KJO26_14865 [Deltaproteobacteria bacterium]|nr:hypothetical protein [Deltaproteobacteria bacterium]
MEKIFKELLENGHKKVPVSTDLNDWKIWHGDDSGLWRAKQFDLNSYFYPIYKYKDYYSYSLINLIIKKGCLHLNEDVGNRVSNTNIPYVSSTKTIDRKIIRLKKIMRPKFTVKSAEEYAQNVSNAMCSDISTIETSHPGKVNIILCGGRDSLNLLLLPWKNPVVVASARPNYELVKHFVEEHDLGLSVILLEDVNTSLIKLEILLNCCRNDLAHCRWGYDLRSLARKYENNVVFWKGQLADTFLTIFWRNYIYEANHLEKTFVGKARYWNKRYSYCLDKVGITQRYFFRSLWNRGAMWQGVHMAFLRQLTNSLVLSGYHGPAMQKAIENVDLYHAVKDDVRPLVGKILYGRSVKYPPSNPGPPTSRIREGISNLDEFKKVLSLLSIDIC